MPPRTEHRAFTMSYHRPVNRLVTQVGILPLLTLDKPTKNMHAITGTLWDTGATMSFIKPTLFERLRLCTYNKAGLTTIAGAGGKKVDAALTLVHTLLTPTFWLTYCPLYILDFPGNEEIVIGMDVIAMGDFIVCNTNYETSFSFVMPPLPNRISFTNMANTINKTS